MVDSLYLSPRWNLNILIVTMCGKKLFRKHLYVLLVSELTHPETRIEMVKCQ